MANLFVQSDRFSWLWWECRVSMVVK